MAYTVIVFGLQIQMLVHAFVYTHTYTCRTHILFVRISTYVYLHRFICICTCTHTGTYIYIYIDTYIYIYMRDESADIDSSWRPKRLRKRWRLSSGASRLKRRRGCFGVGAAAFLGVRHFPKPGLHWSKPTIYGVRPAVPPAIYLPTQNEAQISQYIILN